MNEEIEEDQFADADTLDGPIESDERRDNGGVQALEELKGSWAIRSLCKNDSS